MTIFWLIRLPTTGTASSSAVSTPRKLGPYSFCFNRTSRRRLESCFVWNGKATGVKALSPARTFREAPRSTKSCRRRCVNDVDRVCQKLLEVSLLTLDGSSLLLPQAADKSFGLRAKNLLAARLSPLPSDFVAFASSYARLHLLQLAATRRRVHLYQRSVGSVLGGDSVIQFRAGRCLKHCRISRSRQASVALYCPLVGCSVEL